MDLILNDKVTRQKDNKRHLETMPNNKYPKIEEGFSFIFDEKVTKGQVPMTLG